ncbi:hypothetical protein [Xanthomonas oryzae]|uniref:hypothetical protein n=1 Tax=Xanthomonas oryzae TaxID=347 RepID=UPI001034406A|nr:hypothetical protein [Xanthomonas oryzae]QBH02356.1 hypothetical protein EYC57_01330 [Xanthomonas oryzae]
MKKIYFFLKMILVPISSCIVAAAIFFAIFIRSSDKLNNSGVVGAIILAGLISAIVGSLVGCPVVIIVDWKWSRFRSRYVVSAVVGAILGWLFLEGAFAEGAWKKIWTSSYFWHEWAPRRIVFFSAIGLLSGLLYTGFIFLLDRFMPGNARKLEV